jgi:hypothetical protein
MGSKSVFKLNLLSRARLSVRRSRYHSYTCERPKMASTISSSSSMTPTDSVSSVSVSITPEVLDDEHRRIGRKTFRREYLERLKSLELGGGSNMVQNGRR